MADELKQQVLSYLETHNTMTLGTCSGDVPWAATVFYASDDLCLYFSSVPDSRHCQNLAANPRVAVTVQEDYHDWPGDEGHPVGRKSNLGGFYYREGQGDGGLRAQVPGSH